MRCTRWVWPGCRTSRRAGGLRHAVYAVGVARGAGRCRVHLLHLGRVLVSLLGATACVVTSEPLTGPVRRQLLAAAARASRRRLHVVLVDTTVAEALDGQRRRGRQLGARRTAHHARRWTELGDVGVDLRLDRRAAAAITSLVGPAQDDPRRGGDVRRLADAS